MKKKLKMLCKVRNTLLPNESDPFIQKMISTLNSKINSIQEEEGLTEDTTETYKMKTKNIEYDKSDRNCRNLQVESYDFVRGKLRKDFRDVLRPMTKALVDSYRYDQYVARFYPDDHLYWKECHCISGENPLDNLENCRAHWMREYREDGFEPSYWWRKEPYLEKKIRLLKQELSK
tara:strand:- start:229 stop:756 length:528 start_codon:yes stop_codon:yes gene_type:complete